MRRTVGDSHTDLRHQSDPPPPTSTRVRRIRHVHEVQPRKNPKPAPVQKYQPGETGAAQASGTGPASPPPAQFVLCASTATGISANAAKKT